MIKSYNLMLEVFLLKGCMSHFYKVNKRLIEKINLREPTLMIVKVRNKMCLILLTRIMKELKAQRSQIWRLTGWILTLGMTV